MKPPKKNQKSLATQPTQAVGGNSTPEITGLYTEVRSIIEAARRQIARSVNTGMVLAYWKIGEAIVIQEQEGKDRAGYGDRLIESLGTRMAAEGLKGFGRNNLWYMRQFYLAYPDFLHAARGELSWTHYRLLMKVENLNARSFYEAEAVVGNWSTRELDRQIGSLFYERAALSSGKREMLASLQATGEQYQPHDFVKDPYVLEFLNFKESSELREADMESALIGHLQEFLLELGKGFSFVGRQRRLTIDGDHFYVDLVFYNRLLKCFVLIDLKIGKLTHQDLGQMQLYVNYYTHEMREEWENPAIGILLCADKNDTVVKYTLPKGQQQIFASRYRLHLPSEKELVAELKREQELLAQTARLEEATDGSTAKQE